MKTFLWGRIPYGNGELVKTGNDMCDIQNQILELTEFGFLTLEGTQFYLKFLWKRNLQVRTIIVLTSFTEFCFLTLEGIQFYLKLLWKRNLRMRTIIALAGLGKFESLKSGIT